MRPLLSLFVWTWRRISYQGFLASPQLEKIPPVKAGFSPLQARKDVPEKELSFLSQLNRFHSPIPISASRPSSDNGSLDCGYRATRRTDGDHLQRPHHLPLHREDNTGKGYPLQRNPGAEYKWERSVKRRSLQKQTVNKRKQSTKGGSPQKEAVRKKDDSTRTIPHKDNSAQGQIRKEGLRIVLSAP